MSEALERRLVAVMFTDMVGYTALLQADERLGVDKRERYLAALERHHATLGGTIVQRLGDGSMSMFPSSFAAVKAAVAIQQELAAQDVAVRIGIHAGEVIVEPERLTGEAVNVAARVESFTVPGSIFISETVYEQVRNQPEIDVSPLGPFRLKNVGRPLELYAVAAPGLAVPDRSALEGKGEAVVAIRATLPQPSTPLLGRRGELTELADLVRRQRVVTITGPGGVGKTRALAELGRILLSEFPDGLAFVPFADVSEPGGFIPALAAALDVKESEDRTLGEGIVALVGNRRTLLLLDNLEHIVDGAAPQVAELVERCPELRIAATSRAPLRIALEREWPLGPLELESAVELFAERAGLDVADDPIVAEICRRLDCLPLALELAAARLRLLTPDVLLERLDHALDVLTSGARDSPERHQTLRATIEWSHSLLDEQEKRLFRRLAVFAGGCNVADVEAVCEASLDELDSLVDKALVKVDGRLLILETIREYAREQLEAAGEVDEIAARHAARYAVAAREIRDGVEGSTQVEAVERGIAEEDNLQSALEALLAAARDGDDAARETGLQVAGDLWMYWHIRGKNVSAREWAEAFLALGGPPSVSRAGALITVGLASWITGQLERSNEEWAEAQRIADELGAVREQCLASACQALGLLGVDPEAALVWAERGIEQGRLHGLDWALGVSLTFAGMAAALLGNEQRAAERFTEALRVQEPVGDHECAGLSFGGLAALAAGRGDSATALDLYQRSLASFEAVGDRAEEARILSEMAATCLSGGDAALARRYFFESIQAHRDVASVRGVGHSLLGLAATEVVEGRPERALQIAAAAEVYAQEEGIVNVYSDETPGRDLVEQARAALSAEDLASATERGRRLAIEEALELARPAGAAAV